MARATSVEGSVRVEGLTQLRKTLKLTDTGLVTDMRFVLKGAAEIVAARSRGLAPHKTGALAASIKPGTSGVNATVRSIKPYANVIHWGGTTGRGHRPGVGGSGSVTIKPSLFISQAVEQTDAAVASEVQAGLDQIIRRAGWH